MKSIQKIMRKARDRVTKYCTLDKIRKDGNKEMD